MLSTAEPFTAPFESMKLFLHEKIQFSFNCVVSSFLLVLMDVKLFDLNYCFQLLARNGEKWNKLSTWQIIFSYFCQRALGAAIVWHDSHRLLAKVNRREKWKSCWSLEKLENLKRIQQFEINRKSEKYRDEKLQNFNKENEPTSDEQKKKKLLNLRYPIILIVDVPSVKMENKNFL